MTVPPPPGPGGGAAAPDVRGALPWERQAEIGFLPALLETLRESLFHPAAFFRTVDPRGPILAALVFAVLMAVIGGVFHVLWQLAMQAPWAVLPLGAGAGPDLFATPVAGMALLLFTPLYVPLFLVVVAGIEHLILLALGGPSRGFPGTLRVLAYGSGPQVFAIVPLCGWLLQIGWTLVLNVIGLREAHGIQTGKAVAVVLIPLLLCSIAVATVVVLVLAAGALAIGIGSR